MAKKKKQALDTLLDTGRISQSTYDMFNTEISEAIAEIERQQRALIQKMDSKTVELEQQIRTLEVLLTNFEMQHVSGEVEEDIYQRGVNVLYLGLDTARQELDVVKEAIDQLASGRMFIEQETEPEPEKNETAEEKLQSPTIELVNVNETSSSEIHQEPLEHPKEPQRAEMPSQEKQEA
jgi:hypothetical protein